MHRFFIPLFAITVVLLCPRCTNDEGRDFEARPIPQDFGWSPDGRYFLFVSDHEGEFFPYALDLQADLLLQLDDSPAYARPFTFSPDGSQVAFPSPGISGRNITVYDFRLHQVSDIVTDTDISSNLAWSHDGQRLYYIHESRHELRAYVFATHSVDRLFPLPETALSLALAPDDAFLAGIFDQTVYLLDLQTGKVTEWQDDSICGAQLSWLPDTSTVTFQICPDDKKQLAGLDTVNGQRLEYELRAYGIGSAPWSPTGEEFLYVALDPAGSDEIFIWNRFTNSREQLSTTPGVQVIQPLWSPDGQQIIFWTGTPGVTDVTPLLEKLYIINRDGTGQRELLDLYP